MRKIKGLRWYMIALVTLGTVLGYLTRNTVAAAAPTLMEELNISTQQYSYILCLHRRQLCSTKMSRQVIEQDTLGYKEWAKYKVHENVSSKIKDGAGWPDPDHKTAYTGGIPFPWFGNKLFIYIVPWDCRTG